MLFYDVAGTSRSVASTRSRLAKRRAIARALRNAESGDVELLVTYLAGQPRQRRTGLGWSTLADLPDAADEATLTLQQVDAALQRIAELSGPGSATQRADAVRSLFAQATAQEQAFLRGLVLGEVRQGALDSVMLDAIAEAADVEVAAVRRAAMLRGATAPVAAAALADGLDGLRQFQLVVGRPIRPMLAASAPDVGSALDRMGDGTRVTVDGKLDGIRVQVHRDQDVVQVFSRSLEDITDRLPRVVADVRGLAVHRIILDGEAVVTNAAGRPRPFQETSARTATREVPTRDEGDLVVARYFDCLHLDGTDLLDRPLHERLAALDVALPEPLLVPRVGTDDPEVAQRHFTDQVADGYEGVLVKSPESVYQAGRRGSAWVKVKPRHTLDLVVLAVEWGSGRRTGLLSNIHLGARDPSGGFVMLGKTFKGMTDEMLAWQTERFRQLAVSDSSHTVRLRPEQVVEIAFDGLQRSTRYPGGLALRFARVVRYRTDKSASEADSIEDVRALYARSNR